jgi:hypothetical protein
MILPSLDYEHLLCYGLSCRWSLRWPVVAAIDVNRC